LRNHGWFLISWIVIRCMKWLVRMQKICAILFGCVAVLGRSITCSGFATKIRDSRCLHSIEILT
jgi:hypothetical protein